MKNKTKEKKLTERTWKHGTVMIGTALNDKKIRTLSARGFLKTEKSHS
jgi:hypothetical protein